MQQWLYLNLARNSYYILLHAKDIFELQANHF